ncbi:hypothetical protein [Sulfurisphaera ohwakuensis]|uniref:Uncharacterized protein n=1 Tax=Sulfurisphaera ohwakuensis TaxID=69656 RepID=A0A650CH74_SULOH|nr:hypothetical protein [Sulfurisphaera ohwakuensis]MBB5252382.1 hypothetical protein [Sulfurisphaera ohwakuensis]QGR17162.1 hypothetical protein D1869_08155 [Sulfurisphaera ohwakuensis]
MPIGSIAVFDEGVFNGSIEYDALVEGVKLTSREREMEYTFDIERKAEKVYVILNIERKKFLEPKWRLWLNEFSLTKEFRPNIEVDSGNTIISSIIYDITPIVKQGKNVFSIVYKGLDSITVDSVGHIIFYPVREFETRYQLYAGSLLLKPKESVEFTCYGECYIIAKNPSKDTKVNIGTSEVTGDNEVADIKIEKEGNVSIIFSAPENFKNYGRIYSFYSLKYKVPTIDIKAEAIVRDGYVEIKLVNNSEIDLDKVLANLFLNSISINFKSFNNINKGQIIEYKIPLNNSKGNLNLRVVGIKAGYRKIFDINVLNR